MSTTIDQAFVRQYERDVHDAFQRSGSHLRNTVRTKDGVIGKSTTFQKIGKGVATTKARHGLVTPMNQDHTAIECTLADFYAGDYVDKLDEAKINIDERGAIARGGASALGRKVDEQLTTVMTSTTETAVNWTETSAGAVRAALLGMAEALYNNDVPNDGNVYGVLTSKAWHLALTVQDFTRADWTNTVSPLNDGPPMKKFKDWGGVKWQMHTGLPGAGTANAEVFVYHKDAIGYASGKFPGNIAGSMSGENAVGADITWVGERVAHFVNHAMSGGACLIDTTGVIQGDVDDTVAIPAS